MQLETYLLAAPQSFLLLLLASTVVGTSATLIERDRQHLDISTLARRAREDNVAAHFKSPSRVRKMSHNMGEKFWSDYWAFDQSTDGNDAIPLEGNFSPGLNHTLDAETGKENEAAELKAAYPLHARDDSMSGRLLGRWGTPKIPFTRLAKRDFKCPSGTSPCTSIERPNSCCSQGDVCQIVEDTGLGDVGCCAQGEDCSGQLVSCPEGHSSCPDNSGGGCCIPGYSCVDEGCLFVLTTTVIVTMSPSSTMISTATVSETTTQLPPTTVTASPPSRPTSSADTTVTTTTDTPSSTEIPDNCPTGFYACSAVYNGGCCRTGRDCNTTSCPATSVTTITSNDATVVVPVDTTSSPDSPRDDEQCADGWSSCANDLGGGCCPDGFRCGQISCTASASGIGDGAIGKTPPEDSGAMGIYNINSGGVIAVWAMAMSIWLLVS